MSTVQRLEISVDSEDQVQSVRRKKICASCKKEFDLSHFYVSRVGKPSAYCRPCKKKLNQIWRERRQENEAPPPPIPVKPPSSESNVIPLLEMAVKDLTDEDRRRLGRLLLAWDRRDE